MSTPIVRTITLGSGATQVESAMGRFFAVLDATGTFSVQPDTGPALPMVEGRNFGSKDGAQFHRLTFVNTSGSSNTIQFYAGEEPYQVIEQPEVSFAQNTRTAAVADITGSTAYTNKKFIEVHNLGAGNITVGGFTLAPSETLVFPMLPNRDIYASVTVDATGSSARVITVE